jgi:hypothetical protein
LTSIWTHVHPSPSHHQEGGETTLTEDWQANPEQVSKLGSLINVPVHVVAGNGHMLDHGYVKGVLDRWVDLGSGSVK